MRDWMSTAGFFLGCFCAVVFCGSMVVCGLMIKFFFEHIL